MAKGQVEAVALPPFFAKKNLNQLYQQGQQFENQYHISRPDHLLI